MFNQDHYDEQRELADSNPVKKLINLVLLQAIRDASSDIHFEPFEDEFKMRYRIDGILFEMVPPPKYVSMAVSSRLKVMANLDIAERRMPQDGRIELLVEGRPVDLRVAVLPSMFGESVESGRGPRLACPRGWEDASHACSLKTKKKKRGMDRQGIVRHSGSFREV